MITFPLNNDIFFLLIKFFVLGVRGKAINKKSLFVKTSSNELVYISLNSSL